ncbi:hypothetical protein Bca52824_063616 [Brassica carinata]|uniref:Secreted protein n=1 Tax=Brassica carinata TaxID=52824 RepID=A0A8X7UAG3_BRACI|nr:hypothetical protein Bca52824_063616 [Brassica carinata]
MWPISAVSLLSLVAFVCADAELGHLFRLMRLQPPRPRGLLIIRLLRCLDFFCRFQLKVVQSFSLQVCSAK